MRLLILATVAVLAGRMFTTGTTAAESDREPAMPPTQPAEGATELARSCIKPIKPILSIKPVWCTGTWTQILECDRQCHCEWQPVCLER